MSQWLVLFSNVEALSFCLPSQGRGEKALPKAYIEVQPLHGRKARFSQQRREVGRFYAAVLETVFKVVAERCSPSCQLTESVLQSQTKSSSRIPELSPYRPYPFYRTLFVPVHPLTSSLGSGPQSSLFTQGQPQARETEKGHPASERVRSHSLKQHG